MAVVRMNASRNARMVGLQTDLKADQSYAEARAWS